MLKMLLSFGVFLLAAFTMASPTEIHRRDSPLAVVLTASQQLAAVDAGITNTGATDLSLLTYGSILSDAPVEKVIVSLDGMYQYGGRLIPGLSYKQLLISPGMCIDTKLQFGGILYKYDLNNIKPSDYVTIRAGETLKTTVKLAGLYDFASAGPYSIFAHGAFPYTEAGITPASAKELSSVGFESNKISLTVDVEAAAKVEPLAKSLEKRLVVTSCSGTRQTALLRALTNTVTFANQAATAASSGSATK